jgi:transposase-like protein
MPKGVPNKRYTGEFKQTVVETMMREKPSYFEMRKRFDIAGEDRVCNWGTFP